MVFGTKVLHQQDLDIRQGADCDWAIAYYEKDGAGNVVPQTFPGWAARSQIRESAGGQLWLTQDLTLAVAANKLTVYGHIPAATTQTDAWNARSHGVWDLELVRADGSVIPLASGLVRVDRDVTRP